MTRGPSQTKTPALSRARRSRSNSRRRLISALVANFSGCVEGTACGLDQRGERRRLAHCKIGEHLAVDLDVRGLQPGHETRVRHVVLAARSVDADDPEPTELAFAGAPVAVRVAKRVHDLLVRLAEVTAACTGVTLRLFED